MGGGTAGLDAHLNFSEYGFSNGKTFTDPAWSEAGPSLDLRILIVSKKI